jgi:hypothetical protein
VWQGNISTSAAYSTTQSDSSLVADTWWNNGHVMGDWIKNVTNNDNVSYQPARDPNYVRPYAWVSPGFGSGPYPMTSPDGISSIF